MIKEIDEQFESGYDESVPGEVLPEKVTTKVELVQTASVDLTSESLDIANKIIEAQSEEELKKYTDLFNLSMVKKNAVRIVKLNSLHDKVLDQAEQRIERRSDEFSNKELLDYMKTLSDSMEKAQANLKGLDTTQMITLNQQKNTVNVTINNGEEPVRSRESKEKIIQAVRGLLKLAQESNLKPQEEPEVVDVVVESSEDDNEEVYIVENED